MRSDVDVAALLAALGISARRDGRALKALCPAHDDKSPSWSIVADGGPKTGSHHCFACGFSGGPWELVAKVRGVELADAGRWIRETLGGGREIEDSDVPKVVVVRGAGAKELVLPHGVQIPSVDGSSWFGPAIDYLHGRGIPDWQVERWHVGFATRGRCAFRVVVPVTTRGRLVSYVARAFIDDGRIRYLTPARREGACPELALFGEPGFDDAGDVVTVAEGVFSMMALERAGAPNPCAILGSQNLGPMKLDAIGRFRIVLVATDPDPAGDKTAAVLERELSRRCDVRRVALDVAPDDADDADLARRVELALR